MYHSVYGKLFGDFVVMFMHYEKCKMINDCVVISIAIASEMDVLTAKSHDNTHFGGMKNEYITLSIWIIAKIPSQMKSYFYSQMSRHRIFMAILAYISSAS